VQFYPIPAQPPPPPPPPKQGLSSAAIALIAIAVVGGLGLLVGVPLAYGIYVGFTREMAKSKAVLDPAAMTLSETYATPNGLVTGHYPAEFVAKKLDDATIILSRNFGSGEDEVITLAGVRNPITNDPRELGRVLLGLVEKNVTAKGGTSTKKPARDTKCLGKYEGVEVEGTFTIPPVGAYRSWSCFFLRDDRGYELRYDVPESRAKDEVPVVEKIVAATEIAP
jgi:hypothetical protein